MRTIQLWRFLIGGLVVAAIAWTAGTAQAVVVWDEGVDGDLSNNRLAPTSLALEVGSNTLTATSIGGGGIDREYVTFSMPPNSRLMNVRMEAYSGTDETAFIGVQSGTTLTEPPTGTNPANLLGYTHFGTINYALGDDVLTDMGLGFGSMGFTPPLAGGNYTFWIQQTGASSTTYTFDFVVAPEPATAALLGIASAAMALGSTRRRRR